MFCDVCLVGLSLTVSIFSIPLSPIFTPPPFHPYMPYPFNSPMGPFCWYYFTLLVPLLSPLCPLYVSWVCRGPRPVNVAFALLIFILLCLVFFIDSRWLKRIKSANPVCLKWFACYIWPLCVVFNTKEWHVFKTVSLNVKMFSDWGSVKFACSPVGAMLVHSFT
jgi:hypothetical protein